MRNYLCHFCTIPCKRSFRNGDIHWICGHCKTEYHIDLHDPSPYHLMEIKEWIYAKTSLDRNNSTTEERLKAFYKQINYLIQVDFLKETTTVYLLCDNLRTKVLTVSYIYTKSVKYFNRTDTQHWLEYNLSKTEFPQEPPPIKSYKCHSCQQDCINSNPRYNLYWDCRPCHATYYLDEEPPYDINTVILTCDKDDYTNWSFIVRYRENTTTLSYCEDKCETEVLKLDFIVKNVFAHNLQSWIQKKLIFL